MMREESRLEPMTGLSASIATALKPRPPAPGYASRKLEATYPVTLSPLFIDRCRRAYLSVEFERQGGAGVLGITSSLREEGKTSVAIGIATAVATDTQRPTLLLECDLERPSIHRYFGFQIGTGLADLVEGTAPLRILRAAAPPNLYMIPSGEPRDDASRLFYQLSEGQLLEELRPHFGTIVIDLPPMLDIGYSSLASQLSDRILLVARYGVTSIEDLEKTVFLLGRKSIAGIVLNGTEYKTPEWLRRLL
jgi:Mrp family chromosome partitioning ATPase